MYDKIRNSYSFSIFFVGRTDVGSENILVDEMFASFKAIGVNMSLKLHFLHKHLNCFQENLRKQSDQHGERFHQELISFEKRFASSPVTERMLADYIWLTK